MGFKHGIICAVLIFESCFITNVYANVADSVVYTGKKINNLNSYMLINDRLKEYWKKTIVSNSTYYDMSTRLFLDKSFEIQRNELNFEIMEAYGKEVFNKQIQYLNEDEWNVLIKDVFWEKRTPQNDVFYVKDEGNLIDELEYGKEIDNRIDYDYFIDKYEMIGKFAKFYQSQAAYGIRYKPYAKSTIGKSGCGPAALTMVLNILNNNNELTIEQAVKWAEDNNMYENGHGTKWEFIDRYAKINDHNSYMVSIKSGQELLDKVNEYIPRIILMKKGYFTDGGHFVLVYREGNFIRVIDSASIYRSNLKYDPEYMYRESEGIIWVID